MKIEHVAFNVPDAVKAAQWYVEHLGMQILRSSNESPYIHFLADLQYLLGLFVALSPRQFTDVNEPFHSRFDFNKGAKSRQARDLAFDDRIQRITLFDALPRVGLKLF